MLQSPVVLFRNLVSLLVRALIGTFGDTLRMDLLVFSEEGQASWRIDCLRAQHIIAHVRLFWRTSCANTKRVSRPLRSRTPEGRTA